MGNIGKRALKAMKEGRECDGGTALDVGGAKALKYGRVVYERWEVFRTGEEMHYETTLDERRRKA